VKAGGAESSVSFDLGLSPNRKFFEVEWTPGASAKFYYNGVLVGTITTSLPSGAPSEFYPLAAEVRNETTTTDFIMKLWQLLWKFNKT
jgi:hypothetical protein